MSNKRKKETDTTVIDILAKATTHSLKCFETVAGDIKNKKAKTVDAVARKIKETKQHLEIFTNEKISIMEKHNQLTLQLESGIVEASKTVSSLSGKISLMDKKLKDMSKYVAQIDLEIKNELQGLDNRS